MNGTDMKKAAINKAKQVAQAANSNGGKKRRKGQDLKPIITAENQGGAQNASPSGSTASFHYKYVPDQQPPSPPTPITSPFRPPPLHLILPSARAHTHRTHTFPLSLLRMSYAHATAAALPHSQTDHNNPAVCKAQRRPTARTKCTEAN